MRVVTVVVAAMRVAVVTRVAKSGLLAKHLMQTQSPSGISSSSSGGSWHCKQKKVVIQNFEPTCRLQSEGAGRSKDVWPEARSRF